MKTIINVGDKEFIFNNKEINIKLEEKYDYDIPCPFCDLMIKENTTSFCKYILNGYCNNILKNAKKEDSWCNILIKNGMEYLSFNEKKEKELLFNCPFCNCKNFYCRYIIFGTYKCNIEDSHNYEDAWCNSNKICYHEEETKTFIKLLKEYKNDSSNKQEKV